MDGSPAPESDRAQRRADEPRTQAPRRPPTPGLGPGGTRFRLFVNVPLGTQPGDPPSANFTVTNEAGTVFGTVAIHTDQVVNEFTIQDLTAAFPGGLGPNFGSVLFVIEAPGFGLLETTYSALGLYSVGVPASCHTPAP